MGNIKIGFRLIAAFVVVAALAGVVGGFGYNGLHDTKQSLDNISKIYLDSIETLAQVRFNMRNVIVAQRTLLIPDLSPEERRGQYANIETARKLYREGFEKFESLPRSTEIDSLWKEFKDYNEKATAINTKCFNLIKEWEGETSDKAKYDVALETAVEGLEINRIQFNTLSKIIQQNKSSSDQEVVSADATVRSNIRNMVVVALITPVIAFILGILLTLSISRPLGKVVIFSDAVASGKLDEKLDVLQKDEIGQVADSLRVMVKNLNEKIEEANEKTRIAAEESEKALVATQEAQAAKEQAERAKAEGMLQAAQQLEGVVQVVSSASEELSAQIEQSSRGADEQSGRVRETATAMEFCRQLKGVKSLRRLISVSSSILKIRQNRNKCLAFTDLAKRAWDCGCKLLHTQMFYLLKNNTKLICDLNDKQVKNKLKECAPDGRKFGTGVKKIVNSCPCSISSSCPIINECKIESEIILPTSTRNKSARFQVQSATPSPWVLASSKKTS